MMQPTPYFPLPSSWYNTVDPNYLGWREGSRRQTVRRWPGMTNLQADEYTEIGPGGFDLMRRTLSNTPELGRFPKAGSTAMRQALGANYPGGTKWPLNRTMIPERQRAIAARQAEKQLPMAPINRTMIPERQRAIALNHLTQLEPSESPDMVFRDGYFTPSVAPYLHDPTPTGTFVRSQENPRESAFWQRHDILNPTFRQRGTSAEEGAGLFSAAGMKLASEMIRDATKGQGQGRAFTSRMGRRNIQPYMTAADVAMFASPYLEEERNGR